jgi:hypothetical protein
MGCTQSVSATATCDDQHTRYSRVVENYQTEASSLKPSAAITKTAEKTTPSHHESRSVDAEMILKQPTNPIEPELNVIMVYTNPAHFKTRHTLAVEYMKRMELEEGIRFYVVELAYNNDAFEVADSNNPRHLRLRSSHILWHKENMINIAVHKLLPADWQAFAWIDCDVLFQNRKWAGDTLRLLNGTFDIVQLFTLANDLAAVGVTSLEVVTAAGYHRAHQRPYTWTKGPDFSHPGYAWAMNRNAWNQLGELIDINILGSSDWILALCLFSKGDHCCRQADGWTSGYRDAVLEYERRCSGLKFGYVPGTIDHFFHGHKANRQYNTRAGILISGEFDPAVHLRKNVETGLLEPTESFPARMRDEIVRYYHDRKEDEV